MAERLPEVPEPDSKDQIRKVIIATLGPIPGASLIADLFLASPFQDRLINWLKDFAEKFELLCERVESIDPKALVKDEVLRTTMFNAMRLVTYTHRKEKHEMLRNAVLNSAMPNAPEDDERTVFLNFFDEFSVAHILILKTFSQPVVSDGLGFSLEDSDWKSNVGVGFLFDFVQNVTQETKLDYNFFILVLSDLHSRGLISNTHQEIHSLARSSHWPELTTFGCKFLKFIESPLDD